MRRAYQSPYSAADCGPQWFHMPSLASANQSGMWYAASDSRVPLNGPGAMEGRGAVKAGVEACAWTRNCHNGELTPAAVARADVCRNLRRVNVLFILNSLCTSV